MMNRFGMITETDRRSGDFVKKIKVNHLKAAYACHAYVNKFTELFPTEEYPDGVEPTVERCLANADTFDFYWAGATFFSPEARKVYTETYNDRRATAIAEYNQQADLTEAAYTASTNAWTAKWRPLARFNDDEAKAEIAELQALRKAAIDAIETNSNELTVRLFAETFADDANLHERFDEWGNYEESRPEPIVG